MVELLDCTPAEGTPMTDDRLPLAELMAKADDGDFLRSVAESVLQILMEADVEGLIGASRHECSAERLNYEALDETSRPPRPQLLWATTWKTEPFKTEAWLTTI